MSRWNGLRISLWKELVSEEAMGDAVYRVQMQNIDVSLSERDTLESALRLLASKYGIEWRRL